MKGSQTGSENITGNLADPGGHGVRAGGAVVCIDDNDSDDDAGDDKHHSEEHVFSNERNSTGGGGDQLHNNKQEDSQRQQDGDGQSHLFTYRHGHIDTHSIFTQQVKFMAILPLISIIYCTVYLNLNYAANASIYYLSYHYCLTGI